MKSSLFILLFLAGFTASAQETFPLWADETPGVLGKEAHDIPTLTAFWAENPVGTAVVICPGGGYHHLAMEKEGKVVAEWFQQRGVHAFVLKYRLGTDGYHHPIMKWDGLRAMRLVRSMAIEKEIDPNKIGIVGFSAGGHLAATVSTTFDSGTPDSTDIVEHFSSRPNFTILAYPVISMIHPVVHKGSRSNLLGQQADDFDSQYELSAEKQIKPDTPPAFLVHTTTDRSVIPEHSIWYYLALRRAGIPAEMHLFQEGEHGLGMFPEYNYVFAAWPTLLETWMGMNHWLEE